MEGEKEHWSIYLRDVSSEVEDDRCGIGLEVKVTPRSQRSVMGGTAALARSGIMWNYFAGCFG